MAPYRGVGPAGPGLSRDPKKGTKLSRLGELLNTQKNVHFLALPGPPPGEAPGGPKMHLPGTPSGRGQKPPFLNKKRSNWPGMGLPGEASRGASRGPPGGLPGGPAGPGGPGRPGPARAGNFPPGSLARAPAREGSREGSRRVVLEGGFQTLPDGDISTDPIG